MDEFIQRIIRKLEPLGEMAVFFYQRFVGYHRVSSWFDMASGTAYYFLLGFLPFLVFLVNVTIVLMSSQIDALYGAVGYYLPERVAGPIMADIRRIVSARSTAWMWVTAVFAMYSFVQGIEILIRATDSLDYARTEELAHDIRQTVLVHIKGVIFTLGLMVVILFSLGLPVFGNAFFQYLNDSLGLPEAMVILWDIFRFAAPFAVIVVWLMLFYIFAPHSYTPTFRQSALTSLLVTCAWLLATAVYSWCMLMIPSMGIAYGSLFGLFVLFIWFKFIATAIILGLEFLMALSEMELRHKVEYLQAKNVVK